MRARALLFLAGTLLAGAAPGQEEPRAEDVVIEGLAEDETRQNEEDVPGSWKGSLGLSYVLTSGNTETETAGLDLAMQRIPDPWGLELTANILRAEASDVTTADRRFVDARATRRTAPDWRTFAGLSYLRDTFAGYESRWIGGVGGTYLAVTGTPQSLTFDMGLTYTDEERTTGETDQYFGVLAGVKHRWTLTETATFRQSAFSAMSLDDNDNWRGTYNASLTANISSRWALRVGFEARYENQPVESFGSTDTKTDVSLVLSF